MEPYLKTSSEDIRISNSPRRSPQITHGLKSPATSVYPLMQQLESMHGQMDLGLRTADFFDDNTSDEEEPIGAGPVHDGIADQHLPERRGLSSKKRFSDLAGHPTASQCKAKGVGSLCPSSEGYQRLTPSIPPVEDRRATAHTPSSSLVGSVDELLPGPKSSPPVVSEQPPQPSSRGFRNSTRSEAPSNRMSRAEQTLGAYAIAHDITLQALLRDEHGLDKSLQSVPMAPLQLRDRHSLPLQALHSYSDPRSPRDRHVSSPLAEAKHVHLVPPPIDTSAPHKSLPPDIVCTPFPFSPEHTRHKDFPRDSVPIPSSATIPHVESVLTISIRQTNNSSRRRVTTLNIPATNDFSAIRSSSLGTKERHFRALDFDDTALFQRLRKCYIQLMGPWCVFSARSLRRIVVRGLALKEANRGYWIHQPRSPRMLAYSGLKDTFSEEHILQHYRKPALGKSRYAFVHWAHRLAAARPTQSARSDSVNEESISIRDIEKRDEPEGLEFVVSWSMRRISVALLLVFAVSILATLLWIFLGRSSAGSLPPHGGYRDAGDRVTAGVVMGICLLLLGLSGIAGWLGISWLVM